MWLGLETCTCDRKVANLTRFQLSLRVDGELNHLQQRQTLVRVQQPQARGDSGLDVGYTSGICRKLAACVTGRSSYLLVFETCRGTRYVSSNGIKGLLFWSGRHPALKNQVTLGARAPRFRKAAGGQLKGRSALSCAVRMRRQRDRVARQTIRLLV